MVSVIDPVPALLTATVAVTRETTYLPCIAEVNAIDETLLLAVASAWQVSDQVAVSHVKNE